MLRPVQTIEHVPRQNCNATTTHKMFASLDQKKPCTMAETIAAVLLYNEPFFIGFFHELKGIPCHSVDDILTRYLQFVYGKALFSTIYTFFFPFRIRL